MKNYHYNFRLQDLLAKVIQSEYPGLSWLDVNGLVRQSLTDYRQSKKLEADGLTFMHVATPLAVLTRARIRRAIANRSQLRAT